MPTQFVPIPGWRSKDNQGADIAIADINGDGQPDLVVFQVDSPDGANHGYYRVGFGLAADGEVTGGWTEWIDVPDWYFWDNQGAGLAIADLTGNGRPDLIVFHIDSPPDANGGFYKVGRNLDAAGNVTGGWSGWTEVPDWYFWENQGGSIAATDITSNGVPDLIVFHIDNPPGPNGGFYRVGFDLDADGNATGGWSPWQQLPDWPFWENQGAGIAVADLDGNGRPDLVVFQIDNPPGPNGGFYCVGWDLDLTGVVRGGWSDWIEVPDWPAWENQGGGIALADVDGDGTLELVLLQVDSPFDENAGLLAVVDLEPNGTLPGINGAWRMLPFGSGTLAMHAALLHTGKVLLFSGTSNNPVNIGNAFRSVVWDYKAGTLFAPPTPADFFCAGQAFLADGRLLVSGGTKQYDPFQGLRDAFLFDPADDQWKPLLPMDAGRWYPTLVSLGDGRVLALSGLGEDGQLVEDVEVYTDGVGWQTLPQALSRPWPMYAHVFLLADGRLFYSGGQYDQNFGMPPSVIELNAGTVHAVAGLPERDLRNQSVSFLMPPAQDGRVVIAGGGADYAPDDHGGHHHGPVEATTQVSIVNPSDDHPHYHPGPPLALGRMHHNAVILPDRTVMLSGGSGMDESTELARLNAEIYHPATNTWSTAAAARVPRLYHSVALLMPDGRVMTAGSNPERGVEELRIEIYHPPYLFRGSRPVITMAPVEITYGAVIIIETAQAAGIQWINLIRPGATTHTLDTDQRLVDVPFMVHSPTELMGTVPLQPGLAPPGWYMLFLTDNAGVPSEAHWVHLS